VRSAQPHPRFPLTRRCRERDPSRAGCWVQHGVGEEGVNWFPSSPQPRASRDRIGSHARSSARRSRPTIRPPGSRAAARGPGTRRATDGSFVITSTRVQSHRSGPSNTLSAGKRTHTSSVPITMPKPPMGDPCNDRVRRRVDADQVAPVLGVLFSEPADTEHPDRARAQHHLVRIPGHLGAERDLGRDLLRRGIDPHEGPCRLPALVTDRDHPNGGVVRGNGRDRPIRQLRPRNNGVPRRVDPLEQFGRGDTLGFLGRGDPVSPGRVPQGNLGRDLVRREVNPDYRARASLSSLKSDPR
jgi:hypothetical protein